MNENGAYYYLGANGRRADARYTGLFMWEWGFPTETDPAPLLSGSGIEIGATLEASFLGMMGHQLGQIIGALSTRASTSERIMRKIATTSPKKKQILNKFKGMLRIEKGVESIPKSIQKANGVKLDGVVQKPWHIVINGKEFPVNPFNILWRLYK